MSTNQTISSFFEEQLSTGVPLVVEFKAAIDRLEGYAEKGMRATVTGYDVMEDGQTLRFYVDYSAFEDFNQALETANYYGRTQQPTLTAREAGQYEPTEHFYVDRNEPSDTFFTPVEQAHALMTQWRDEGAKTSYVQFLEARVVELQASLSSLNTRRNPTP